MGNMNQKAVMKAHGNLYRGAYYVCQNLRQNAVSNETLASLDRDRLRDTQFVKSDSIDHQRATELGSGPKLLHFDIPGESYKTYEAVLDSISGFIKCSEACAHLLAVAKTQDVKLMFGIDEGYFKSLVLEPGTQSDSFSSQRKAVGIRTRNKVFHRSDVVVIAGGSISTQLLPDLSYHLESSAGSIVTFKVEPGNAELWNKYAPENFSVITWKSFPRDNRGRDTGSIYVFPRTQDGIIKIGYRGIKFTNFVPVPESAPFTQHGQWSIPLTSAQPELLPQPAIHAIHFAGILIRLDNSFLIDFVLTYADQTVFVCTGVSGHGAKFLPVLGKRATDILGNDEKNTSFMYQYWRWRDDKPRCNGLEEGPQGSRNIGLHPT